MRRGVERRPARWLLGLLLVQVAVVAVWVFPREDVRLAEPRAFAPLTPESLPLTVETGSELASRYAAQWRDDARLVTATARVSWPGNVAAEDLSVPADGWITYVFVSGDEAMSVSLERVSGGAFGRFEGPWGSDDWTTLELTTYPFSSTTALLTAEVLAGQAFRAACPGSRRYALVSPSVLGGEPVWTVTYRDDRDGGVNAIVIRVNADSGEVVTREVRESPCNRE